MKDLKELFNDSRVKEAKRLLLEAVSEKRSHIQKVKPPNPKLIKEYKKLLDDYGKMRGGPLFYPFIGSGLGNGALVELMDESVKYDFITGIGVHCFGHSHPDIINSSVDAALTDVVMEGHLQQNSDAIELTELLLETSGMDHCFLSSTGVMANENAFKICFQKRQPANRILAFDHCFTGRTITMSQVTDKAANREGIPLTQPVDYIPFFDYQRPEESTAEAVKTLKNLLIRYPGQHCGMSLELVQGEGGFNVGTTEFFTSIMEILKDNDIPVVADEVQTFGRTSQLFAFQHFGLEEYIDIVTIGKLSQACATLYKSHLLPTSGLLSQTFTTSSSAMRASKVIIEKLINDGHYGPDGKNMQIHQHFTKRLEEIRNERPELVEGPYGIGGMIAFTPLGGDVSKVLNFTKKLFEAGVMSFIAGRTPARCRFLVPLLALNSNDIDNAMKIIKETLITSHQ
ncbi:MAG: Acetylornithine aminotransferase [Chlamydiae bacterium]|nr:Acetylornithine aminotransferase [Chlamydiota bacterium]